MKTVIPEITQIDCDFCGASVGLEENTIKLGGSSVEGEVPIGPTYLSGEKDLCHSCYSKITSFIRTLKD